MELTTILAKQGGILSEPWVMIVLMIVIFYFLIIRPQAKRQKEQDQRISSLKKGDQVVTIGGLHGLINAVGKDTVSLKVSEGNFLTFNKVSIATISKPSSNKKTEESTESEKSEG